MPSRGSVLMHFGRQISLTKLCKMFAKRVAWPLHCYLSLLCCFDTFFQLVVGAQHRFPSLDTTPNGSRKQHFENEKSLIFFVYCHEKATHAQHIISQVLGIKLDRPCLMMSHLRTAVHMLRNTFSESTVICHIQIKVVRVTRAVLSCCLKAVLYGGGGGAGIGLQPSSFRSWFWCCFCGCICADTSSDLVLGLLFRCDLWFWFLCLTISLNKGRGSHQPTQAQVPWIILGGVIDLSRFGTAPKHHLW